jgi:predicted DNA binding protein
MSECLSCEDKALAYYNAIKTKEERLTRCNEEKSVYYSAVNALNESKEEEEMEEMKVIITNDCNDTYNVILTEKQYAFLEFLSDNGLLYDSVDWQIVKDENFERIN